MTRSPPDQIVVEGANRNEALLLAPNPTTTRIVYDILMADINSGALCHELKRRDDRRLRASRKWLDA